MPRKPGRPRHHEPEPPYIHPRPPGSGEVDREPEVSPEYMDEIRRYTQEGEPRFRAGWIRYLADYECSWEQLESWVLDPSQEVRSAAYFAMTLTYTAVSERCWSDKGRCVALLESAATNYHDTRAVSTMASIVQNREGAEEWFPFMRPAVGRLRRLSPRMRGYIPATDLLSILWPEDDDEETATSSTDA